MNCPWNLIKNLSGIFHVMMYLNCSRLIHELIKDKQEYIVHKIAHELFTDKINDEQHELFKNCFSLSVCHCTPPLSPTYGNSGDNYFSSITALLKALHCGDLLRVTTLLFIIVNSTEVYICVISQARHCRGARKVTAQHISHENGPVSWTEWNTVMKFCIYLDIDKM